MNRAAALALQFLPDLSPLFMSTTFSFSDASSSCRKHVFEDQVATIHITSEEN